MPTKEDLIFKTQEEIDRDWKASIEARDKGRNLKWNPFPPASFANRTRKYLVTCGAERRRGGGPCLRPAGWNTDHPGSGLCSEHERGSRGRVKKQRYDGLHSPRLRDLLAELENDPNPLDLLPEVRILRALVIDYIERYDRMMESLMEWRTVWRSDFAAAIKEWKDEAERRLSEDLDADLPKFPQPQQFMRAAGPTQILDVSSAGNLIDKIGGMVDRIEKHKSASGISLESLNGILEQVGIELVHSVRKEVADEALRERILATFEKRWQTIKLEPNEISAKRSTASNWTD